MTRPNISREANKGAFDQSTLASHMRPQVANLEMLAADE